MAPFPQASLGSPLYCSCLNQVVVLGVEDVVDLTGHPLLGNDLLPVRPGVVPVPLPVKPQGQLANLTVSHRVSLRFSRSACQSHCQLANLTVSLPISRSACQSHCQLANLTVSLPISLSACQSHCQLANLTISRSAAKRQAKEAREQAESRPRAGREAGWRAGQEGGHEKYGFILIAQQQCLGFILIAHQEYFPHTRWSLLDQ